jgi:hypothetical protein
MGQMPAFKHDFSVIMPGALSGLAAIARIDSPTDGLARDRGLRPVRADFGTLATPEGLEPSTC